MPGARPCGAPPGRDSRYCFWHDPDKADDLAEAQRLGGQRRRRERTIAAAYEFTGLGSVEAIGRLFDIAATDALYLENSIARGRLLISAGLAALRLIEVGELEARIAALEQARARLAESSPTGGLLGA
jgi:uncharacterized small protein (DUF1192 family)